MGTIILVRHGENDWSRKDKLAGRIPGVHLNETGHQQAHAVAQRLAALPIKAVYSSPITRCAETAAYIADIHHLSIQYVDEVSEVEYGEWEGKKVKRLTQKPLWWTVQYVPSRARFPQGEALREVQFRAIGALEAIAARHEKELVVVVSHADVIRLLLAHYLGVHIDLFQRLVISPASASILALSPDGMVRVLRINDDGPMHPPTPEQPGKGKKKDNKPKTHETKTGNEPSVVATDVQEGAVASPASADGNLPSGATQPAPAAAGNEEE